MAEHTGHTPGPWKRWNQAGSVHAKLRMDELRGRKAQIRKAELIDDWSAATGRPRKEWWDAARDAGLVAGCGAKACIDFLMGSIALAKARAQ